MQRRRRILDCSLFNNECNSPGKTPNMFLFLSTFLNISPISISFFVIYIFDYISHIISPTGQLPIIFYFYLHFWLHLPYHNSHWKWTTPSLFLFCIFIYNYIKPTPTSFLFLLIYLLSMQISLYNDDISYIWWWSWCLGCSDFSVFNIECSVLWQLSHK